MLLVEPTSLGEKNVELGTVGISSMVSHSYPTRTSVGQGEVLVVKTLSVNTFA